MTEALQPILKGELQPTDVPEVEAKLSALWRAAAEDPSLQHVVTRACALTLLIAVETEEAAREVNNLIAEVTRQNPCRAIVMVVEPEATPAGLSAWISAHCHLPAVGEKQLCSEQITLHARGEAVYELPQVVLPLTVSDLPIYLWLRAGRFSLPAYFGQILRVSTQLVVDSARFRAEGTDLRDLASWVQKGSGNVRVTDLNWARLTPWRELLAQCFDSPERRPYLDRLTWVRIEYEPESPRLFAQRAQGQLLTGWLASRLGWDFVKSEAAAEGAPRSYLFQAKDRLVKVERVLRRIEGGGGGVCFSIELAANGSSPARFSFARGADGVVVQTHAEVPGSPPIGRSVRLEALSEAELLNGELKVVHRDHVYEETLSMVARMTAP